MTAPDLLFVFLAVWLFSVGACVGSFLNVVIYRVPAGVSISANGSACPICGHAIRAYDNVPLFSWFVLGGRCRDCRTPIAGRYPFVEALVAAMFLALGWVGPLQEGRYLPRLIAPVQPIEEIWATYFLQVAMLCTLFSAGFIAWDGKPIRRRLFFPVVLTAFVTPMIWPFLHPVAVSGTVGQSFWWSGLANASSGAMVGLAVGSALIISRPKRGEAWLVACHLVGLVLGWQAVSVIVAAALVLIVLCAAARLIARRLRTPPLMLLTAVAFAYLLGWFALSERWPQIVHSADWRLLVATLLVAYLSGFALRVLPESPEPVHPEGVDTVKRSVEENLEAINNSPTYRLAELDTDFLQSKELRPVRLQLELLKAEMGLVEAGVELTIVAFGGTQIVEADAAAAQLEAARSALEQNPDDPSYARHVARAERVVAKSRYYDDAREFSRLVSTDCKKDGQHDFVVVTGGGPGIMEAANRGAFEADAKSIGFNITLPHEQHPNPYITPELCFQFHYFAIRKMHFLLRAKALVVFPGGFGTLDELFDALTLRQTARMQRIPIILFGQEYWEQVINFQFLADEGVIADAHLDLIDFAETPAEAWKLITDFHGELNS